MHLKGKFPFKQNKEIKELIEIKKNSYIVEDEYSDIVYYMFNKEDAAVLLKKLKTLSISQMIQM